MEVDELDLNLTELPEPMHVWLHDGAAVVLVERTNEDHVRVRHIPDVDLALLARIGVTMAKYRETLMNLT